MNVMCVSSVPKREHDESPDGKSWKKLEFHLRALLLENLKILSNSYKYHTFSDNRLALA